jgi:DNA-binding transcriptional LysR family regulator
MEDMKNLTVFVRVARSGSFTAAASELGMSTAAVSKLIARLERRLATRLLTRSTRALALTPEGRLFLEKVEIALDQVTEAMDLLRETRREPAGKLRLWSSVAIGKDHLLPILAEFLSRYPKLEVEVRFDDHLPNLIAAGYDLAIHHTSLLEGTSVMKRVAELPLALVASTEYLARHGAPTSPDDITRHQCVVTRSTASRPTRWEFRRRGTRPGRAGGVVVEPKGRVVIAEQYDAVLDAALCGLGLTVAFTQSALRYLRSGELKVLLPDWEPYSDTLESNHVYLWYPHRTYVPLNVRVLIDFLTARLRQRAKLTYDLGEWLAR